LLRKISRHWDTVAPQTALALSRCRLSSVRKKVPGLRSSVFLNPF
jgi:hypothetical protein